MDHIKIGCKKRQNFSQKIQNRPHKFRPKNTNSIPKYSKSALLISAPVELKTAAKKSKRPQKNQKGLKKKQNFPQISTKSV